MGLFFDFLPVILFFLAFKFFGIYAATAVAMVASVLQIAVFWVKNRRYQMTHVLSAAIILLLGGATLILQDELLIKWKPTVINWLFALVFLVWPLFKKSFVIEKLLGKNIKLPRAKWKRLNFAWVIFFLVVGGVNLFVAYNFSTEAWVNFKLFGVLGFTLVFIIGQTFYISPELKKLSQS